MRRTSTPSTSLATPNPSLATPSNEFWVPVAAEVVVHEEVTLHLGITASHRCGFR
jgi:hypothetical protein